MQVKCILFPLDWVINKSYSFKSEWKETVEKKDLLGAEGGRPDLILSPTFSFSWSKPSIGDQLRRWWILFNFVLWHEDSLPNGDIPESLFPQKSKVKTAQYTRHKEEGQSSKASGIFCNTITQAIGRLIFFFFFSPQYLGQLPPQPQIPGLLSTSGETSQFNSFSESMPGLRAASHRWWAPSAFIFTSPLLNNNSKFVIIFEDSIGIKTNITQAGFHYYIFIIIVTQNLNILLDP